MYFSTYQTRHICRRHKHPEKTGLFILTSSIRNARCPSRVWSQVRLGPKTAVITMETRTPIQNAWRSSRSLRSLPLLIRAATEVNSMYRLRCAKLTARSCSDNSRITIDSLGASSSVDGGKGVKLTEYCPTHDRIFTSAFTRSG
jgi:hypothetical protein